MKTTLAITALAAALSLNLPARAADRALLVGVGRYANPANNLTGIDLDINAMTAVTELMGFAPGSVRVLSDEQATKANIVDGMQTWLVDGVGPNDRVLFYYSGHGTHFKDTNGDETDGEDEAIVPHDVGVVERDGQRLGVNYLVDEELATFIAGIPSRNVLVIIDACHSGTATRSLSQDASYFGVRETFPKFLHSADTNVVADKDLPATDFSWSDSKGANYVAITAARDDETAVATRNGSVFTLGVYEAIHNAVSSGRSLTPAQLRVQSERYVAEKLSPASVHHPQVGGDPAKVDAPLPLAALTNGPAAVAGTRWTSLRTRVDEIAASGGRLTIATARPQYRLGEPVEISVKIPVAGYLNVVSIDANDNTTVLFPNQYNRDNRVTPGSLSIPTPQMNFTLPASEPAGDTLVAVFLTSTPVNLYDDQVGGKRNANGDYAEAFAQVSGVGMRAISIAAKEGGGTSRAGGLIVPTLR
jgi:hypothetical protein